jgi:hypothetical protein
MMDPQQQQQQQPQHKQQELQLVVSYRGQKVEIPLQEQTTVEAVKTVVAAQADPSLRLQPTDVKLLFKGKVLQDNDGVDLSTVLLQQAGMKKVYRLVAMGVSSQEVQAIDQEFREGMIKAEGLVRDDLTDRGRKVIKERQRKGRYMLSKAQKAAAGSQQYGFGTIETIPNLPLEQEARQILTSLANDPGILACMAKHKWNVGSLAELYPEGKVGESAVCVMGLNKKAGQQILLRLRTDDLRGFRKILNIRKVLYHELAHNEHSEHNGVFFQLMRQVEHECTTMDWTGGSGLTDDDAAAAASNTTLYTAGTYRLGGGAPVESTERMSVRELAARAALMRMTAEEQEIQENCGCGRADLFLPPQQQEQQHRASSPASHSTSSSNRDKNDDDGMDVA